MYKNKFFISVILGVFSLLIDVPIATSGVFDLPSFVEPGKWSVGAESEVIISKGAGAGINIKPRYGLNNFLNLEGLIGISGSSRGFRLGAIADFEWFPDVDKQPGIATPFSVTYYRYDGDDLLSLGPMPLLYMSFKGDGIDFTPFIAIPIGWNVYNKKADGFVQIALGTMFRVPESEKFQYVVEAGFDVTHSYSYIAGGATYFH